MTTGITTRVARIADLPARPLLTLLELVPQGPERLASLQVRPAAAEGRVLLEVASASLMARIEADGDCARPIALPRGPLAVLRRRHPDAERLVLDQLEVGVGLRSFGPDATVALTAAEGELLPELPLVELPEPGTPGSGDDLPLLLDPQLLISAVTVLRRLARGPVRLELLSHPVVGAAVAIHPGADGGLQGSLQLARCVPPEAR